MASIAQAVCCLDPVCDYLLWALYRQDHFDLCPPVAPGEPITERYGHFPQFAVARGARGPEEALALLPEYAREELAGYDLPVDRLRAQVAAALPFYEPFLAHWQCEVKPLEQG